MCGAHHAFIEYGDIGEELVERHVLLCVGPDEIVKLQAGDGDHRLAVEFSIVEPIQKVDSTRAGGGNADADPACEFGPRAGHERSRFFMANLDKADLLPIFPEGFDNAVNAV